MNDLTLNLGNFNATTATVAANTAKGRAFLAGVVGSCAGVAPVSCEVTKSFAFDIEARATAAGLKVA